MTEPQHFELIKALANLARAAPHEWEAFQSAYKGHFENLSKLAVMSPSDMVQVNQGRAREALDLLDKLKTCIQQANQIDRARANA